MNFLRGLAAFSLFMMVSSGCGGSPAQQPVQPAPREANPTLIKALSDQASAGDNADTVDSEHESDDEAQADHCSWCGVAPRPDAKSARTRLPDPTINRVAFIDAWLAEARTGHNSVPVFSDEDPDDLMTAKEQANYFGRCCQKADREVREDVTAVPDKYLKMFGRALTVVVATWSGDDDFEWQEQLVFLFDQGSLIAVSIFAAD